MADPLVMVITREAVEELDLLLDLMDRAAADPDGQPVTMDVLFGAGFTQQGLGAAHDAVRRALADLAPAPPAAAAAPVDPSPSAAPASPPPVRPAPGPTAVPDERPPPPARPPRTAPPQAAPGPAPAAPAHRPTAAPATFEDLPEDEKHTALLDEVVAVLTSVRALLVGLVVVAVVATLLAGVALVR